MLQQEKPDDYVIAAGEARSVREFFEEACAVAGLKNPEKCAEVDARELRPADVGLLVGDAAKARKKMGWRPKTTFKKLVRIMMDAELRRST